MSPKNLMALLLIFAVIIFSSTVNAEIKEIIGVGEHYMEYKSETIDHAKNQAKLIAELDVIEKARIHVESYSTLHNSKLTRDEIVTITAGITDVKKIDYKIRTDFDDILILVRVGKV